jgi:chromosome segregation ATPase
LGWAKYFEDIQKLRDQAASLRDARIDDRAAISSPEKAIGELRRLQDELARWSEELVAKLEEILEQATDPEINRQVLIDNQDTQIAQLNNTIGVLNAELEGKATEVVDLVAALRNSQAEGDKLKRSLDEAKASFLKVTTEKDALKKQVSQYEQQAKKIEMRRKEDDDFKSLMAKDGTRPIRK